MSSKTYVGWDIGGAHLKMASIDHVGAVNFVKQLATPIWKGLGNLENAMSEMCNQITEGSLMHAITMTAELADIFKSRKSGVRELTGFLEHYFDKENFQIYAGNSGLIESNKANSYITDIASANWHATASFVAQNIDAGVLIDIGSTTTDIIPFASEQLFNIAYTDHERLRDNELIYTGVIRTPVMAVVNKIFYDGQWQSIAAENFSTMADIYRLSSELNEQDDILETADGAGKTPCDSARRLARMVGLDLQDEKNINSFVEISKHIAASHLEIINESLLKVLSRHKSHCLVGAGAGSFLIKKLARINNLEYVDFTELLTCPKQEKYKALSCATAVSVAQIARLLH